MDIYYEIYDDVPKWVSISLDQSIVNKRQQTRTILYISKHRILNEGGDSIDG